MEFLSREDIDYDVVGHQLEHIVNYHETSVLAEMRALYEKKADLCRCEICIEDIYALALNSLSPRYVQETRAGQYERSSQFIPIEEVRVKVEEAAAKVGGNPNH